MRPNDPENEMPSWGQAVLKTFKDDLKDARNHIERQDKDLKRMRNALTAIRTNREVPKAVRELATAALYARTKQ